MGPVVVLADGMAEILTLRARTTVEWVGAGRPPCPVRHPAGGRISAVRVAHPRMGGDPDPEETRPGFLLPITEAERRPSSCLTAGW